MTSIARDLTYKTAAGKERTVSRRALYNAFKAHDAERAAQPLGTARAMARGTGPGWRSGGINAWSE